MQFKSQIQVLCGCLWNILPLGISCCITISKLSKAHLGRTKAFTVKLLISPQSQVFKIPVERLKYYEVCPRWPIKFHVFDFCIKHGRTSTSLPRLSGTASWNHTLFGGWGHFLKHVTSVRWKPVYLQHFLIGKWGKIISTPLKSEKVRVVSRFYKSCSHKMAFNSSKKLEKKKKSLGWICMWQEWAGDRWTSIRDQ